MSAAELAATTPFGAQLSVATNRLPGYPGKARQEKVHHQQPRKPYEWKERLVRNAGTRGTDTSATTATTRSAPR